MRKDLHNYIAPATVVAPAVYTSTQVGAIIDLQGYDAIEFLIQSGVLTTGTWTPLLEHGNDPSLSDAATVPTEQLLGSIANATFAATDDNKVKSIGYIPTVKRYLRLTLTGASTPNGLIGASAIKTAPYLMPAQ